MSEEYTKPLPEPQPPKSGPSTGPPTGKRFYLSTTDKKIAGVCGGLGEYLGVDPMIIRLATVILCLVTGIVPFVVAYALAWLIVPARPAA